MKTLTFKDKKTFNFVDASTIGSLQIIVSSFADLDEIKKEFETENNLIGGTFDGAAIAQTIYTGVTASAGESGNITATFNTRPYTQDEIFDARLTDLETVVADM